MRIRTVMSFTAGAAAGATALYLLDPEHGDARRREARRWAARQAREQARDAGLRLVDLTRQTAGAAADGFREAQQPSA